MIHLSVLHNNKIGTIEAAAVVVVAAIIIITVVTCVLGHLERRITFHITSGQVMQLMVKSSVLHK